MLNTNYKKISGTSNEFHVELDSHNQITMIQNSNDRHKMNWTRGKAKWGSIKTNLDLSLSVKRKFTEVGTLLEEYVFSNPTDFDIYVMGTMLGIYTPFPDYYTDAATCMTQCCSAHIWCGGSSSYIMALRMGGEAPNLGLLLREGNLKGYSVERMEHTSKKEEELSNHRGDFILHPDAFHLRPGESYTLSWELFWFSDKEDFMRKLKNTPDFFVIESDSHILLGKEGLSFSVHINHKMESIESLTVKENGCEIPYEFKDGEIRVCREAQTPGVYDYEVLWEGKTARASFLKMSPLWEIAERRCRFIAEHQQCHDEKSHLNGAYLIYDNEEKRQYYDHRNDYNGGRERVGMGVLMACFLQKNQDAALMESLDKYIEYVLRELFDENTGEVFNDVPRCRDYIRLYNYPWISRLFLEMYKLKKEPVFLDWYFKSAEYFYKAGGEHYYAIGMPMYESVITFCEAGKKEEGDKLLAYYRKQVDFMLECGRDYPAHEVDYEQSIVAPAAIYMCELYKITKEEKYKKGAVSQLQVLELFQGFQPDYHMNEVAIRHWDGYWFGKRKCLGDTFPHYWSSLSGYAYAEAESMISKDQYTEKARKTLRGVLSLYKEDGSASCAMVYPMSVNGKEAHFYDPWANDQDWGLYYMLKYSEV